jgi:hypothetical protein
MNRIYLFAPAAILLLAALPVAHAEPIECNGRLVSPGDTQEKLLELCGEPASRDGNHWIYQRQGSFPRIVTIGGGVIMFIEDGQSSDLQESSSPLGDHP